MNSYLKYGLMAAGGGLLALGGYISGAVLTAKKVDANLGELERVVNALVGAAEAVGVVPIKQTNS